MQIRRLNGGRLAGSSSSQGDSGKDLVQGSQRNKPHISRHILSLEVGGPDLRSLLASMKEPAKLFQQGRSVGSNGGTQYVIREAEAERAPEIAGEFYPHGDAACNELAEASIATNDEGEVIARICELTHRLGYNEAKTKMSLGQWARNLAGLERKLLNEFDEQPGRVPVGNGDKGHGRQHEKESSQANGNKDFKHTE